MVHAPTTENDGIAALFDSVDQVLDQGIGALGRRSIGLNAWRQLERVLEKYLQQWTSRVGPGMDREIRGRIREAQLMVASGLMANGQRLPGITDAFSPILIDLIQRMEGFRELDVLSEVELARRAALGSIKLGQLLDACRALETLSLDTIPKVDAEMNLILALRRRNHSRLEKAQKARSRHADIYVVPDHRPNIAGAPASPVLGGGVTAQQARLYELNLASRFVQGLKGARVSVWDPSKRCSYVLLGKQLALSSKSFVLGEGDQTTSIDEAAAIRWPVNLSVSASHFRRRFGVLVDRRPSVVVGIGSLARVGRYAATGSDSEPLGMEDLMGYIGSIKAEAEREGFLYILGVGSPTGWSAEVRFYMDSGQFGPASISPRLALCLIDGATEELIYAHDDRRLSEGARLFMFN